MGYFPMPEPDTGEIVFLRPDPRAILPLNGFHCSRSLKRVLNRRRFHISFDQAFEQVMKGCADREDTWITPDFLEGYCALFDRGIAHSLEVWDGTRLVGGVYGVAIGSAFFAESKFHLATDASKVGLYFLVEYLRASGFTLLEVQFLTPHLATLGAIEIADSEYLGLLKLAVEKTACFGDFRGEI